MQPLPDKPIDVFKVFDISFKRTLSVLKETFGLVILITLAQAFIIYVSPLSHSHYFNVTLEALGFVVFIYLCGALLYQTDQLFKNKPVLLQEACQTVLRRGASFFAIIILLIAIVVAYYLLVSYWMRAPASTNAVNNAIHGILYALVGLVPVLLFIVFEMFAVPLVLLRKTSILRAIPKSYRLVGTRWLPAFTVYAMIGIICLLVTPTTRHAHFFLRYHLLMLFNFAVFCLLLPFVTSYILVMFHDLETRLRLNQREVMDE